MKYSVVEDLRVKFPCILSDKTLGLAIADHQKTLEPSPMASHQTLDASPAVSSKKKKHSKKRRATDVAVDASTDVTVDASTDVTVDASFTGAAAPVVGYFPTGYDPLAADQPPSARLFRHEKHRNRVELVVSAPGKGPDFVGRSYAGEAAARQLCGYALGVLDKASGTLKIVPIAANKVSVSIEWFSYCLSKRFYVLFLAVVKWYGNIIFMQF